MKRNYNLNTASAQELVDYANTFEGSFKTTQIANKLRAKGYNMFYDTYLERWCLS